MTNSSVVEMSLRITKASYNKSDKVPMKWAAIDSDIDEDLYQEKMSLELYQDFVARIENKTPIPEQFMEAICENDWCGGMPYLSIAHYKAGSGRNNVPGDVESVFIDGTRLKSKGTLHDSPMGRKVFDALREDLYMEKSGNQEHLPVRISIGFLDLEHKHRQATGPEFTFTRTNVGEICPLCSQGIGGKIYTKGQLVHLAMTRVPVNPRTEMSVERSMDIQSKKDDAESIIGKDLVEGLEEKSMADGVLVVRSDAPTPANMELCDECYDPNTDSYDQACVDGVMSKYVSKPREDATVKSKALFDAVQKSLEKLNKSNGNDVPVVEDAMAKEDVKQEEKKEGVQEEKSVLGIPEKPFTYAGLDGNGNNNIPNPVKSEDGDSDDEDEMEKSFTALRSAVLEAKRQGLTPEQAAESVNKAFAKVGTAVENTFTQKSVSTASGLDAQTIAEIVRSAIAPLQVEIASLKSQVGKSDAVSNGSVVKSKALNLGGTYQGVRPEDLIQRALPQQPTRKLSKIEEIAYRSTGALK